MCDPRGNALRHSTDDQIIVVCLQQPVVENFLDRLLFLDTGIVGVQALIRGLQKLVKGQRVDVKQIHHAYGIGLRLRQKRSQQTAGGDHMVFIGLFLEIFQSIQRFRALLDLVENNQCFFRQNFLPGDQGQQFDDPLGIFIGLKDGFQFVFLIKVEVNVAVVIVLSELLHQPGLSHLPGAFQHHRLAVFTGLPCYEFLNCIAFQSAHRPSIHPKTE